MSPEPADRLRLFVAIELPDAWRVILAELQQRQERAAPGYFRWVQSNLLHLTLLFLGWTPSDQLGAVGEAVEGAAGEVPPFRLALGPIGTFGPPRTPRVLWVDAPQPDGRLQQLHAALAQALRARQIDFDQKPLVPHVTLGRGRQTRSGGPHTPTPRLLNERLAVAPHRVSSLTLFDSQLRSDGPRYTRRLQAALGAGRAGPRSLNRPS